MSGKNDAQRDTTLRLSVDDPEAGSVLGSTVDALLSHAAEHPELTIALDGVHLPSPMIAVLVKNLRRLREIGGTIAIEPATPALRDAFALHGLQWVFKLRAMAL